MGGRSRIASGMLLLLVGATLAAGPATPGAQLWVNRWDGSDHATDHASFVAASPDGSRVFVTGYTGGSGYDGLSDYGTAAYDPATGAQLWGSRYNGTGNSDDHARSIAVSPDASRVFLTGWSFGAGGNSDIATVAYDAVTGTQLWVARYNSTFDDGDEGSSLAVSPDGSKVFVTGDSFDGTGTGYVDMVTVAYEASTGSQLWVAPYADPFGGDDVGYRIAAAPDGSKVFVTGWTGAQSGPDYGTVAYDASSGAQLWARSYNGPGNSFDQALGMAGSPDGSRVFVTGWSTATNGYYDYATLAYDASTGSRLWLRRYNGPGNVSDTAYAIAVTPDGAAVVVTGFSDVPSGYCPQNGCNYATVAYSAATGAQRWVKRYNGPGQAEDIALAVATSPDSSKVFVTGYSIGLTSDFDYATLAYGIQTGVQLWLSRYNGPANDSDIGHSVVASPDGSKVFVTGASTGANGYEDYATVAYSMT
jgi:hypothetical protein